MSGGKSIKRIVMKAHLTHIYVEAPQGELPARKNCVKKLLSKAINVKIPKRLDLTESRCHLLASGYDPEIT